ncbi:MAG: retroviral-like aspartic protease family protein [Magnetococcales bacterium]|nr:retroviral-like aspartic protease family protein [Magnetococcales bacterium]
MKHFRGTAQGQPGFLSSSRFLLFGLFVVLFFCWSPGPGGHADESGIVDPTRPDHFAPPPAVVPPTTNEGDNKEEIPKQVEWKRLELGLLLTSDGRKVAVINGRRFMEGDVLDSGPLIEKINDDSVVLSWGGEKRTLRRHSCFSTSPNGSRRTLVLSETCAPRDPNSREIPLTRRGRTLYISATLNSTTTVEFVLDTGASVVSLPRGIILELMDAKAIANLPSITVKTADGRISKEKLIKLESIQVGPVLVKDISAVIAPANAPALLGMSLLDKLGGWHIDNKRQLLIIDKS